MWYKLIETFEHQILKQIDKIHTTLFRMYVGGFTSLFLQVQIFVCLLPMLFYCESVMPSSWEVQIQIILHKENY